MASLQIALWVTLVSLLIAFPVALLVSRRSFAGRNLVSGLMLIPLILPPFVGGVGMKIIFARFGALTTLLMKIGVVSGPVDWLGAFPMLGVVVMESLHLFPILFLNLAASFSNIDPTLEEAGTNMGASPVTVFRRITLPLALPGLFAGVILVFIWSFTELGTPLVFGVRNVLPVLIYDSVSEIGTNPIGYAEVVLLLLVAIAGFALSKAASGKSVDTFGRVSVSKAEKSLSIRGTIVAWGLIGIVLIIALIPHISVVLVSLSTKWFMTVLPRGWTLDFFRQAMSSPLTQTAMKNSLLLSVSATLLISVMGFFIAWLNVRTKTPGAGLLDAIAMIPLAAPGIVLAFGYLGVFSGWKIIDPRVNPMLLLAISYAIRRLPFMVRSTHAGLQQTSRTYEEAAANLGASPWRVIRRVTLPLVFANMLAGGILCFAFSMLEVSDSMILAQSEQFFPLTKAIYTLNEGLEHGVNVAAALGVWAMGLLAAAMLWTASLLGRKMGQLFRAG
ncbi:MAG: iron ABC transporter permease [Spirochaetes bacterium]|nr:iron ABC transporter permease [Spirochaetota bacterium]